MRSCVCWVGLGLNFSLTASIPLHRGITVRVGSGCMFVVAYAASAVAENTSSCVPAIIVFA